MSCEAMALGSGLRLMKVLMAASAATMLVYAMFVAWSSFTTA